MADVGIIAAYLPNTPDTGVQATNARSYPGCFKRWTVEQLDGMDPGTRNEVREHPNRARACPAEDDPSQ